MEERYHATTQNRFCPDGGGKTYQPTCVLTRTISKTSDREIISFVCCRYETYKRTCTPNINQCVMWFIVTAMEHTFTSMLPCCVVVHFFLNNQPDALIIQILFCYNTLHVSGIFSAHHQEFSIVHSALVSFMQVLMTVSKQSSSILTLLGNGHQNLHETYQCRM